MKPITDQQLDALTDQGWAVCEFEDGECDRCDRASPELYFRPSAGWDSREGDYACRPCALVEVLENKLLLERYR